MLSREEFLEAWERFDHEALHMPRFPTSQTLRMTSKTFNDACMERAEHFGVTTNTFRAALSAYRRQLLLDHDGATHHDRDDALKQWEMSQ